MIMLCLFCNKDFELSGEQERLISMVDSGKMKFVMLECGGCHQTFSYKAQNADKLISHDYRCPVEGCIGFVAKISDVTDFDFGCGECGTVWLNDVELFDEIRKAVLRHPYRKKVYVFDGGGIKPVDPMMEPKGYEKNVLKEIAG